MKIGVIAHEKNRKWLTKELLLHKELCSEIPFFADWSIHEALQEEIPVIPLEEIGQMSYDALFVAIPWGGRINQVLLYLKKTGLLRNTYVFRTGMVDYEESFIENGEFSSFYVDYISGDEEKPFLAYLETHVCDACNLNCKACTHFSPFVKSLQAADIRQFEEDMENLAGLFAQIGCINLLGGEPLLKPELCMEMMQAAREWFPRSRIGITTNGLLVPKMKDTFWESVRKNNVVMNVSVYEPTEAIMTEILQTFDREEVLTDPRMRTMKVRTFAKFMSRRDNNDAAFNNEMCAAAGCYELYQGFLGKCPETTFLHLAEPVEDDWAKKAGALRISEQKNGWEVLEKLTKPVPMCFRCDKIKRTDVPWEQVKGKPDSNDWFVE